MARTITFRRKRNFMRMELMPGQMADPPMEFFTQPEGEDRITEINRLGTQRSPFVRNLVFSADSMYVTRNGTEVTGTAASSTICGLAIYSPRTGSDYIVRVTTTGVDYWAGSSWIALSGPVLAVSPYTIVEFTVWDNNLVFSDASTGIYTISISSGTYALISGSPAVKHLTTFGGRVIGSYVTVDADPTLTGTHPTRIEWCVKNDNTNWLGLGSGYEDLLSAPGGVVDIQHGVVPVTDSEAFVLRSSSIWIMRTTGYFETPFNFTYRFDQGTDSPSSIIRVPSERGGDSTSPYAQLIMLGLDDVLMVHPEKIVPIGLPIRDELLNSTLNARTAIAGFEPRMREYWLHVPPLTDDNTESVVWRYRIDEKRWYHTLYPFKITRMAFRDLLFATTYDQLTGTIEDLAGPYDNLGLGSRQPGAVFAVSGTNIVVRERLGLTGDVTSAGAATGIPIQIRTGEILPSSVRDNLTLVMLELLYESSRVMTVTFEYSEDGGTTWTSYGTLSLAITTTPTIVPYRFTKSIRKVQLRVTATDAGGLQFHGLYVKTVKGSPINQ